MLNRRGVRMERLENLKKSELLKFTWDVCRIFKLNSSDFDGNILTSLENFKDDYDGLCDKVDELTGVTIPDYKQLVFKLQGDIEDKIWERNDGDLSFLKEIRGRLKKHDEKADVTEIQMVFQMLDDWIDELEEKTKL